MPSLLRSTPIPPIRDLQWHSDALARVLEDGVVVAGAGGAVLHATDAAQALLGGPASFPDAWRWLRRRIDPRHAGDDPAHASGTPRDHGPAAWTGTRVPARDGAPGPAPASDDTEGRLLRLPAEYGGRDILARLILVEDDGIDSLCLLKDRRSLRELRRDLRLALQARRRSAALRGTAHDLKAPLQSLALNLDLMRQHLRMDEFAEAEERVELVWGEVQRLNRMVRGLLSASQLPREVERAFDLRRLVRDVVALLEPQARAARVEIDTRFPDVPVTLRGVRDHLEQALVNVVVNAIEAMPDGGRLFLDLAVAGGEAVLTVRDTGTGLPPALKPMLFELHVTTKADGTGLGLYTSRATVREMGGELDIADAPDGGCRVTIRMPWRAEAGNAAAVVADPSRSDPDPDPDPDGPTTEDAASCSTR